MSGTETTHGELNDSAVRIHHLRPLILLALGTAVVGAYLWTGDTLILIPVAIVAFRAHGLALTRHSRRHTVMATCRRCANLGIRGPIGSQVNRVLTWYFHRRLVDAKAAMLVVAAGVVISAIYWMLGKPHAMLPFLVTYELFLVQTAVFFRSLVVHRGNEASCRLCAAGDEMHPLGRVQASELEG